MSAGNEQPTPSLAEWLNTATEKLSLPAKERIKLEITSHFEDALESYMAEGLNEPDAQAKALADLGDARSAARRFQREHLTESDVRRIKHNLGWNSGWRRRLNVLSSLGLGAAFVLVFPDQFAPVLSIIIGVVNLSLGLAYYFITRPRKLSANVSAVLLIAFMLECVKGFALGYLFGFMGGFNWLGATSCSFIVLGPLCVASWKIRFWLKLRRMADVWQEMPPPGATAS
jgi:hypothetical protein